MLFALACFYPTGLLAGSMTAEIDKTRSSLDEPFWLTVSIQGSLDGDVVVPETKDFEINRSGESTNISIVNGSMTKERQYTYQVRALKEGQLTIPTLKAKVDNEDLQTQPIAVEVKGGVAQPSQDDVAANKKLVFVERELPKTTLYEGEAMVSKVRLLTRARLTGATPARDASPDWRLIGAEGQINSETMRDGARWSVIEMREALIPLKSGHLKAPPFGISASWIQPSQKKRRPGSVFDMFNNGAFNMGEEVSKKITSEPLDVTVKPLPSPQPAEFSDIVGAFTLNASVSKATLGPGETSTITVELKGQGALDRIRDIKLNIPGVRVYADKPTLTEKLEAGAGLMSTRVMKFALVANAPGQIDLGVVKVASFNPFTEKYETLSAVLGKLSVTGTAAAGSGNTAPTQPASAQQTTDSKTGTNHNQPPNQESTPEAPKEILASKIVTGNADAARPWYLGPVALAIEILILAALAGFMLVRRGWTRLKSLDSSPGKKSATDITPILAALESADAQIKNQAFDKATDKLKELLSSPGHDAVAMTSRDMIASAEALTFDETHMEALRRVLAEIDRREYGGDADTGFDQSFMTELRQLLLYCQARSH